MPHCRRSISQPNRTYYSTIRRDCQEVFEKKSGQSVHFFCIAGFQRERRINRRLPKRHNSKLSEKNIFRRASETTVGCPRCSLLMSATKSLFCDVPIQAMDRIGTGIRIPVPALPDCRPLRFCAVVYDRFQGNTTGEKLIANARHAVGEYD